MIFIYGVFIVVAAVSFVLQATLPAVAMEETKLKKITAKGSVRDTTKRVVETKVDAKEMRRLIGVLPFGIDDNLGRYRVVRIYVEPIDGSVNRVYEWRRSQ